MFFIIDQVEIKLINKKHMKQEYVLKITKTVIKKQFRLILPKNFHSLPQQDEVQHHPRRRASPSNSGLEDLS